MMERPKIISRVTFAKRTSNSFAAKPVNPGELCSEISRAISIDKEILYELHKEFGGDTEFYHAILEKLMLTSERPHQIPEFGYREFLYIVVRAIKPAIMIETGSFDGLGTAAILLAMYKNDKGRLFVIDLPNPGLPSDIAAEPAWLVPGYLRARLDLRKGKTSEHLEPVVTEAGEIDMFYHDSWHTYENVMFEYQTAWSALRPGGLLMGEYLLGFRGGMRAFKDFVRDKAEKPIILGSIRHFVLRKSL